MFVDNFNIKKEILMEHGPYSFQIDIPGNFFSPYSRFNFQLQLKSFKNWKPLIKSNKWHEAQ